MSQARWWDWFYGKKKVETQIVSETKRSWFGLKLNIWLIFERFETIELRILTTFRSKKIEISIRQSLFFGFSSSWFGSPANDHGVVPKFLCNLKWPCVIFGPNWWILAQKVWRFWQFTASVFTTEARGWPTDRWNTTKRWSRDDQGVRTLWVWYDVAKKINFSCFRT